MKYRLTGLLFLSLFFLLGKLTAQEMPPPVKNDSITLAQAFINLTLTKEYFEGLSEERVGKILPFEIEELESITDHTFLKDNAGLYNFSLSLLYYNQAKFLFRTQKSPHRRELIEWKVALEKAINYFNLAKSTSSWSQENPFFELINYTEESYSTLHQELFILKSLFTPYFNEDIYPDFKRIFLKAKNSDRFEIDSLAYFAGLFSLEFNTSIIDKDYDTYNYDFGPNTLAIGTDYSHIERDYAYHSYTNPVETAYLLDEKLDLISQYVQLKKLASASYTDSLSWFESYRLYNSFYIFKDQGLDNLFINNITKEEDSFLKTELNQYEYDLLFKDLREKFSYDPYATAQAFINLSLIEGNFETQSNSQIASTLSSQEHELSEVKDSLFIEQNFELYNFTYALLYENTARLLYRSRKNIDRKTLLNWKETLDQGIDYFNYYEIEKERTEDNYQFDELIKFDTDDWNNLEINVDKLKQGFTPYFNEDIYPDFQRIFYKAKNTKVFDFDALREYAGIFNIKLDLSILENTGYEIENGSYYSISKEYNMLRKLNLISYYLQFKYLASDQFAIPSDQFNVELLYSYYNYFLNDLEYEADPFILRELNDEAIEILFEELQSKFPYAFEETRMLPPRLPKQDSDGDGIIDYFDREPYFFPEFAPLASASFVKRNFKPELKTLGKVDDFLRKEFIAAGYNNQLHYYYASDGFAITTSLERFTLDGSTVPADKRFVKSITASENFSYYETFKSMFMDVTFDYRTFAFIVGANATQMSKNAMTPEFAEQLIKKSYDSLPADLINKNLDNKTLSVFVYHFHLNLNTGTVQLDLSGKLSTQDYLKNAGLLKIIQ